MLTNIYIKPAKKSSVYKKKVVTISDAAEVFAPKNLINKIKNAPLFSPTSEKVYLVSSIDIIEAAEKIATGATIFVIGETDTLIDYKFKKKKENKVLNFVKIISISVVVFVGSFTAIMTFQTDAQISRIFQNSYKFLLGENNTNPAIIEIPYAIGLAAGIIIFFNHIAGKKLTDDPTPIEVEFYTYENEADNALVDEIKESEGRK
ncbi:MAG: stage V sporulation protein AA [Clostridiales bacterium]|nr:stage V sporulation protein AA [Clostridiales bacterium]